MGILKTAVNKRGDKAPVAKEHVETRPEATPEAAAAAAAHGGNPSPDDLKKVREILFGNDLQSQRQEMAALEGKLKDQFDRIESLVSQQLAEANEAMSRRLAAVERSIGTKLNEFSTRLRTEGDQRLECQKRFETQLDDQKSESDSALHELREGLREAEGELRNQLLAQGSLLSSSIHKHHEEALGRIADSATELSANKADRAALAGLFKDFAKKVVQDDA